MRQKYELIKVGYVRVSKQEQNEALQIDALKEAFNLKVNTPPMPLSHSRARMISSGTCDSLFFISMSPRGPGLIPQALSPKC